MVFPRGQDQIRVGDTIVVVSGVIGLNDVREILRR